MADAIEDQIKKLRIAVNTKKWGDDVAPLSEDTLYYAERFLERLKDHEVTIVGPSKEDSVVMTLRKPVPKGKEEVMTNMYLIFVDSEGTTSTFSVDTREVNKFPYEEREKAVQYLLA